MAFYETFNLTIDDEIVDPSGYAQGDIQTTYAGTATTITQTHTVDGYKILIEFPNDAFVGTIDLYLEGNKVISSRVVIGEDAFLKAYPPIEIGSYADAADYPNANLISTVTAITDPGYTANGNFGLVGEATAGTGNDNNAGVLGFASTSGSGTGKYNCGIIGIAEAHTPSTIKYPIGGYFESSETHTGAPNYGVWSKAKNATTNYSFYGEAGEMYNLGNVNFAAVCAADTFRLASGKWIGYSADVNTAPTGGLSFNTSNTARFTSAIVCQTNAQITRTADDANVTLRRVNTGATAIANGNIFATIRGEGYDGSAYVTSCEMYMDATQDHSSGKSGGRIVFQTTTNDTATATKRWVIENDGHFTPFANNAYDIGTTSLKVKDYYGAGNVYAATATMGTATSYTVISEEGLKYYGGATTWDDLQFPIASGKVPASNFPDFEALTTNTQAFAFEVGEYIDLQANEPSHGWKEGTSAEFHLHIATKSAIAGESAARFEIIIAHATPTGVFIETSLSANYLFSDPLAKQHFYVDIGSLPLTGYLIGTQLLCRVKRVAETTAFGEYGDEIFITQVGAHLEYDSTGSRTESTK